MESGPGVEVLEAEDKTAFISSDVTGSNCEKGVGVAGGGFNRGGKKCWMRESATS